MLGLPLRCFIVWILLWVVVYASSTEFRRARSCRELQIFDHTVSQDAEYWLWIPDFDMDALIYCHNMVSDNPTEYITLPAGNSENEAYIYNLKTGSGTCSNCCPYTYSGRGQTNYNKVRLDIKSKQVVRDDYAFSVTSGPNSVPFGTAADCFAGSGCMFGHFKVDLTGSSWCVSPTVEWKAAGWASGIKYYVMSGSRQSASATCGGYCGQCRPQVGGSVILALDVCSLQSLHPAQSAGLSVDVGYKTETYIDAYFHSSEDLDSVPDNPDLYVDVEADSRIRCAINCISNHACETFIYDKSTGVCHMVFSWIAVPVSFTSNKAFIKKWNHMALLSPTP